jgi:hypothetical protein
VNELHLFAGAGGGISAPTPPLGLAVKFPSPLASDYQNPRLPDFLVWTGYCRRNIPLLNFPPAQKPFLTD